MLDGADALDDPQDHRVRRHHRAAAGQRVRQARTGPGLRLRVDHRVALRLQPQELLLLESHDALRHERPGDDLLRVEPAGGHEGLNARRLVPIRQGAQPEVHDGAGTVRHRGRLADPVRPTRQRHLRVLLVRLELDAVGQRQVGQQARGQGVGAVGDPGFGPAVVTGEQEEDVFADEHQTASVRARSRTSRPFRRSASVMLSGGTTWMRLKFTNGRTPSPLMRETTSFISGDDPP